MDSSAFRRGAKAEKYSERPWLLTWTVVMGIFVASLLAIESAWRHLGYRPSVVDSPALWQFWYEHAAQGREQAIVLIGSSRIQAGISIAQMHRKLPRYRVSQLAKYRGVGPIGVLRVLASDERFDGIVICDTLEPFFPRENWNDQRDLYELPVNGPARFEAFAFAHFQDIMASKHVSTGVRSAFAELQDRRQPPYPDRERIRVDRSLELDFNMLRPGDTLENLITRDIVRTRRRYEAARLPTPEELADEYLEIDGFVRRIQSRGGQVIFVRMPSSGRRLALEEEFHPKASYWDRFVESSRGVCLHFEQLKGIWELSCPDGSHLDVVAAVAFTDALIDELTQRGIFK